MEEKKFIKLTVKQFIQAKKIRWERGAGFIAWVKRRSGKDNRLTFFEWDEIWDEFINSPAKK